MTFKIASINCIIILFYAIFLFKGCSTKPDESKIKRFEESKKSHQKIVSQELDRSDNKGKSDETIILKSLNTMEVGEEEPDWANALPAECGKTYFCGTTSNGSIDNNKCPDKHVCRDLNETVSRNALSKNIETNIRDETRLYIFSQTDNEGVNYYKEFEKEVRERGSKIPLKNLHFSHFYLTPKKKLFTMVMMERPKKVETPEESQEKADLINLPPLILALTMDQENEDLIEEGLMEIVQLRLTELLSEYSFKMADNKNIKFFRKTKISEILSSYKETLENKPDSIIFLTSLKGEISANSSRLYPGMTRMFLSFSAYKRKDKLIWKKTYETKRPDTKKPETLSASDRAKNYQLTLVKGFNEIEKKSWLEEFKKVF